ncbi:hypothetical protein MNBD_PLANCTO03-1522 [hydrothermal vent metagenome]|uniref:Uncharacterized protein n=1 Tax=hydrothermal vent metagenome TaxID=652676 RepID=A0A3B1DHD5_9ZZZZ
MPGPLFHPIEYPDDGGPEPVPHTRNPKPAGSDGTSSKITFGSPAGGNSISATRHEDTWSRTPNSPGTGAIHVRSFRAKLSDDALAYLDQTINEWLDAHPQYEVKMVNTAIGEWSTKLGKEAGIIVNVWV